MSTPAGAGGAGSAFAAGGGAAGGERKGGRIPDRREPGRWRFTTKPDSIANYAGITGAIYKAAKAAGLNPAKIHVASPRTARINSVMPLILANLTESKNVAAYKAIVDACARADEGCVLTAEQLALKNALEDFAFGLSQADAQALRSAEQRRNYNRRWRQKNRRAAARVALGYPLDSTIQDRDACIAAGGRAINIGLAGEQRLCTLPSSSPFRKTRSPFARDWTPMIVRTKNRSPTYEECVAKGGRLIDLDDRSVCSGGKDFFDMQKAKAKIIADAKLKQEYKDLVAELNKAQKDLVVPDRAEVIRRLTTAAGYDIYGSDDQYDGGYASDSDYYDEDGYDSGSDYDEEY